MPDHVKDLYQRWGATFAGRGELPLDEWRALIEEWPQVTAEPGGVDYVEVDTGGVPAMSPWFDFEATGASYDDNDSKDMLLNRKFGLRLAGMFLGDTAGRPRPTTPSGARPTGPAPGLGL